MDFPLILILKRLFGITLSMSEYKEFAFWQKDRGNLDEAAIAYQKACNGGNKDGWLFFGFLERDCENIQEARKYYQKACDDGDMTGCYNLGVLEYKKGNIQEARRFWVKACKGGYELACKWLKVSKCVMFQDI